MLDQQRRMHEEAAALSRAVATQASAEAATGQQVWQALARDYAPGAWAAASAARQALDEAGADLQEAQHQIKAAELGDDEGAEALAIVRVRRAERRHAEALQAAQQADQALTSAVVHARDRLMLAGLQGYNEQVQAHQAEYQQRIEELDRWAKEVDAKTAKFYADHIAPLIAAGAPLPRQLESTKQFILD